MLKPDFDRYLSLFDVHRFATSLLLLDIFLSSRADRHGGDMSFTVCNFLCNFVCSTFCNGYLRRGLTQGNEIWQVIVDLGGLQVISPFGKRWSRG